jgi:uncharacterized membrane protein YkoI
MKSLSLLLTLTLFCYAEKVVTMIEQRELPAAVAAALAKDKPAGATFRGFERELIDGKTFYEVQMTVAGKGKEILYRPDGRIVETEEESTLDAIPVPAREAIQKAMGTGTLRKVDIIRAGKRVMYEGELLVDGQKLQVRFDGKGRKVKPDLD